MRRAFNNVHVIKEDNTFYGVSLGYDFCAEHEWGTQKMKTKFGIDTSKMGVEARSITKGEVLFMNDGEICVLTSRKPWHSWEKPKENLGVKDLIPYDLQNLYKDFECAWDEGDFCIVTKDKSLFNYMEELNEAFKNNNIVISFIKSDLPVFANSSLSVLIKDKLPKSIVDSMYAVDKASVDLVEYEKKIGVTELKEKTRSNGYKGEKYFLACSASWIDYHNENNREKRKKELGTKYDVRFWVNYSDDDDNYGWYNAEDIIKWLSTPGLKLKSLNKK
jgi:hypothetical protein